MRILSVTPDDQKRFFSDESPLYSPSFSSLHDKVHILVCFFCQNPTSHSFSRLGCSPPRSSAFALFLQFKWLSLQTRGSPFSIIFIYLSSPPPGLMHGWNYLPRSFFFHQGPLPFFFSFLSFFGPVESYKSYPLRPLFPSSPEKKI